MTEQSEQPAETGNRNDLSTISGVKLTFRAKGLLQPEITVRYASAAEALMTASRDAFTIYDFLRMEAEARGITLVSDQRNQSGQEAR